jgi:hypothetical protein
MKLLFGTRTFKGVPIHHYNEKMSIYRSTFVLLMFFGFLVSNYLCA